MKIRQGFVSNSSSSSFLIIGVDSKIISIPNVKDPHEWAEDMDLGFADEMKYIGKKWRIEEYGIQEIATEEIELAIKLVSKKLNVDKSKIKIIVGVEAC